jgi:hypothetical protein
VRTLRTVPGIFGPGRCQLCAGYGWCMDEGPGGADLVCPKCDGTGWDAGSPVREAIRQHGPAHTWPPEVAAALAPHFKP